MLTKAQKQAAAAQLPTLNIPLLEELAIRRALDESDGNRPTAAKLLGINVRTLQRRIVQFGLPRLPGHQSSFTPPK